MDVTPLVKQGTQIIQSYANEGFRVNGQSYDGPICVCPAQTTLWAQADGKTALELQLDDFQPLIDQSDEIDVVLFGSGAQIKFLSADLKRSLKETDLYIDCMDTGAACRTYNVLMAEGRRVFAVLLPVSKSKITQD